MNSQSRSRINNASRGPGQSIPVRSCGNSAVIGIPLLSMQPRQPTVVKLRGSNPRSHQTTGSLKTERVSGTMCFGPPVLRPQTCSAGLEAASGRAPRRAFCYWLLTAAIGIDHGKQSFWEQVVRSSHNCKHSAASIHCPTLRP